MTITLADLKLRARERADMVNSDFVSDTELTAYINSSIAELHDLLVAAYDNQYFLESHTFTTTANTADYALPANFYKLSGVDAKINASNWLTLKPFNFNERNRNFDRAWRFLNGPHVRYRLAGNNLRFTPVPDATYQIRLWYTPVATKLVSDTDELNELNQFSEYVVVDAAIKMKEKEESDVQVLLLQKKQLEERIKGMAKDRDTANPETVSDIYAENDEFYFWRF